ncbi:ribonuclease III [Mailhella massiliensis]|uniref:Ribonuclease 3 n=1 Tax=Mailhella massiliensis TaxID=1903261 RepID=A0A921AY76_9BACT|nr:ribonuclease III [Mailhella massiliensis]HJD98274.1 ribonuclease III [Mailhella massiliensis]
MQRTAFSPDSLKRLAELEVRLGYRFRDISLLATALTHSSWANEHNTLHNERLEFLGDAVLEVNVSHEIYRRFPQEREGGMTRLRSRLVSEGKLAELARGLGLGEMLFMGRGEEAQGGRERPALIADAMEAVLGAVYLDGGHEEASALIHRLYAGKWPDPESDRKSKDYKTRLQEATQARLHSLPVYLPLSSTGPEHAKTFRVQLELSDGRCFVAEGGSLKRAEQEAARLALAALGITE